MTDASERHGIESAPRFRCTDASVAERRSRFVGGPFSWRLYPSFEIL